MDGRCKVILKKNGRFFFQEQVYVQVYEAAPKRPEMFYDGDIFHNIELLHLKDAYFSCF